MTLTKTSSPSCSQTRHIVSRKLFAVLDANLEGQAKRMLKEVKDKNGIEVYSRLNVNYDVMNSETEFESQQAILAMAR